MWSDGPQNHKTFHKKLLAASITSRMADRGSASATLDITPRVWNIAIAADGILPKPPPRRQSFCSIPELWKCFTSTVKNPNWTTLNSKKMQKNCASVVRTFYNFVRSD
jgi:hypothetical protein